MRAVHVGEDVVEGVPDPQGQTAHGGVLEGELQHWLLLGRATDPDQDALADDTRRIRAADDDGRVRVPGNGRADRPEQPAADGAATAGADHHEVRLTGELDERIAGVAVRGVGRDHQARPEPVHGRGRALRHSLYLLDEVGDRDDIGAGTRPGDGADLVDAGGGDDGERTTLTRGFLGGPTKGAFGVGGAVDAHDDASGFDVECHAQSLLRRPAGRYGRSSRGGRDLGPGGRGRRPAVSLAARGRRDVAGCWAARSGRWPAIRRGPGGAARGCRGAGPGARRGSPGPRGAG